LLVAAFNREGRNIDVLPVLADMAMAGIQAVLLSFVLHCLL
jgi:hypothetical protein